MYNENSVFQSSPVKPIVAMVLLLCMLLGFSFWTMIQETNRIDAQRAGVGVSGALSARVKTLNQFARGESLWDDGVRAIYRDQIDTKFVQDIWVNIDQRQAMYDLFFIIRKGEKVSVAFENGKPVNIDLEAQFGSAFRALRASLDQNKSQASAGLIRSTKGLMIVSASNVTPVSPQLQGLVDKNGPAQLVFARYVTPALLKEIGKEQWLQSLRVGYPRDDETSTVLTDAAGDAVINLSWMPLHPGETALKKSAPLLLFGVILFILVAAIMLRQALMVLKNLNTFALTDALSQLPNRRALHADIDQQNSDYQHLALAMIDLDGFKMINDLYGHVVGDQLIQYCASLLKENAEDRATVYRLGGDEFAMLFTGINASAEAEMICDAFLQKIRMPIRLGSRTVSIGASIGIVANGEEHWASEELLRRSDMAMYASKAAGKMRLTWFDQSIDDQQQRNRALEMEMRDALKHNHFKVVYQPLVNAEGTKVVAIEALLRWTKPDGTVIGPAEFIPVAEESGLINLIGLHVLRNACMDALGWDKINLSVNVSAVQLRNPEFPMQLSKILSDTGFPASRLELEVTETYLVADPVRARTTLEEIQALGVKTALDDFGTGYASIGFLRQFPFDKLKIDRSLVVDAAINSASRAMLQASVAVARALNMAVTAEGVETQAQADLARIAGCDQLQGWHYFRALHPNDIADKLTPTTRARQLFLRAPRQENLAA